MKAALWFVLLCLVVAAGVYMFRTPAPNPRAPDGSCLLTGDVRVVEAMGDVVVQPTGRDEWTDVELTLRGLGISPTNAGQPTGSFTLKREVVKGRTPLQMETFQKPTGRTMGPHGDAADRPGRRGDGSRRTVPPRHIVLTDRYPPPDSFGARFPL
jgi:hypothetical protein